jgi:hypothetical protein
MQVWIQDSLDELQAVADLGDAKLVVSDYSLFEEELDEDRLVEIFRELLEKIVVELARLGQAGEVRFFMEEDPNSELGKAMHRALANVPNSVVIPPEVCEEVRRSKAEDETQAKDWLGRLRKAMREEGLRRGLNKEQREKMTLGEFLEWDEGAPN